MHYLIDGHNLIAKLQGIELDDPDDEVQLVLRLRSWAASGRKRKVSVIFDRGLPGGVEKGLSSGQVKVIFAPAGRSADSLLINRINNVRNPGEYTLVSSDRRIVRIAESRRMLVLRSEDFATRISQEREQRLRNSTIESLDDPQVDAGEVEMWLDLFTGEQDDSERK